MLKLLSHRSETVTNTSTPMVAGTAAVAKSGLQDVSSSAEKTAETALPLETLVGGKRSVRTKRFRGIVWTQPRRRALVGLAAAALIGWRWSVASAPVAIPLPPVQSPALTTPNAAHFYAAGTDALAHRFQKFDYMNAPLDEKRRTVLEAATALRLVRQGFDYPYQGTVSNWFSTTPEQRGIATPVPNFVSQRTIARLFIADSQVAAAEGRFGDAMQSALDALRFGQDIGHGNSLVEGMIGGLCQSMGTTEAIEHVGKLNATEARLAINRVAGLIATEQPFSEVMEQERMMVYGTAQALFNSPMPSAASAATELSLSDEDSLVALPLYSAIVFWYGKDGLFQSYRQCMDGIHGRLQMPYQQERLLPAVSPTIPLLKTIIPEYRRAFEKWTMTVARKRVLLARLAVQAYRQEHHGACPSTLEELTRGVTSYLSTVPQDPLSLDGKQTLRFKDGVVYSVGFNGRDDGNTGDDAAVTDNK